MFDNERVWEEGAAPVLSGQGSCKPLEPFLPLGGRFRVPIPQQPPPARLLGPTAFSPATPSGPSFSGHIPVVALASSAGGIHALSVILSAMPPDFPAPILIAQHISPEPRSHLADLLSRRTALCVKEAQQGDTPQPGWVYVTPSGRHIQVCPDHTVSLTVADEVGIGRPSADLLFGSLARSIGAQTVAVVLTGMGHDGARGVRAVKAAGGVIVAQDEASSRFASMPLSAVQTGCVDLVRPLAEITPALVEILAAQIPRLSAAEGVL